MTKPGKKSGAPERRPVIDALAPLGWSLTQIAEVLKCSTATLRNDLNDRGGVTGAFPDRPTKPNAIYAASFIYYVNHHHEMSPQVRDAMRVMLKMEIIECVERGLVAAYETLTRPGLSQDKPLYRLLRDINPHCVHGAELPLLLRTYLDDVHAGAEPSPQNSGQVINALKLRLSKIDRSLLRSSDMDLFQKRVVLYLNREDGTSDQGPLLTEREALVLKLLYGFDDGTPKTRNTVGRLMNRSGSRISDIERKALRKFRWLVTHRDLLDPFRSMRSLRDERDAAQHQLELLVQHHQDLSTVHRNLCDAVTAGNLAEAQAILHLPSEDQPQGNPNLWKRWDEIDLSVRTENCLRNAGLEYVWQVCGMSEEMMLKIKNFGRKSLNEIKEILNEMRLRMGMHEATLKLTAHARGLL